MRVTMSEPTTLDKQPGEYWFYDPIDKAELADAWEIADVELQRLKATGSDIGLLFAMLHKIKNAPAKTENSITQDSKRADAI